MSRVLTFWNDETIKLIREHFVAASVPTWVCRSDSPEGEFLRGAGVHKQWVTSSGYMTCVSASGKMLGRKPCMEVLEAFAALPLEERKPGAVKVAELSPSQHMTPSPPEGGLVLRVHARFMARNEDGSLRPAVGTDFPLMADDAKRMASWEKFLHPNTEYMWLTREEVRALVPRDPAKGQTIDVSPVIAQRMARFHLTPKRATTSEGGVVHSRQVNRAELSLIVENVSAKTIRMTMRGHIHTGSDFDAAKATSPNGPLSMGYATPIQGILEYDRAAERFTRFDLVAPGEVWGRWGDANNKSMVVERPGRQPFGFAFELATGDSPTDRIPPGGNGKYVLERGYFGEMGAR